MLDAIILYSLAVYMVFHVVGRSDILAKPRGWVFRTLPGWLIYPFTCALCFTFWLTLIGNLFGFIQTDLVVTLSAPVVNMVLDLIVKALIRANEPPLIAVEPFAPRLYADWEARVRQATLNTIRAETRRGGMLDTPFNPLDHEQSK